jgi:uncharacterized repeat protein (TIGR01451 family)
MTQLKKYAIQIIQATPHLLALVALFFLFHPPTYGQGWEKTFGGDSFDQGDAVIQTIDRGYLIVGYSESFPNGSDQDEDVYVLKTDVDGTKIWEKTFDPAFADFGRAAIQTPDLGFIIAGETSLTLSDPPLHQPYLLKITEDGKEEWSVIYDKGDAERIRINDFTVAPGGGYLIVGSYETVDGERDIFLLRVAENGDEIWRKVIDGELDSQADGVTLFKEGYVIVGKQDTPLEPPIGFGSDALVHRLDADGELIWSRIEETVTNNLYNDVLISSDGNIIVAGKGGPASSGDLVVRKLDEDGNLIWERLEDLSQGENLEEEIHSIIELPKDSSLVFAGNIEMNQFNVNFLIGKLTKDGAPVWTKTTGDDFNTDFALSIAATAEGGFVIAGYNGVLLSELTDIVLTLTNGEGEIYTSYLKGKVFYDQDGACDLDQSEQPFEDWLVRARGQNQTFYGSSDANGNFLIRVDTGDYVVDAVPINSYWESCSPNGVNLLVDNFYDTTTVNFPMKVATPSCPYMEVDISTPFLAPCTDVIYTVDYSNNGTGDASDSYVEVEFGNAITFVDASIPWTQDGEVYTFQLGDIDFNTSGAFTIHTKMDCSGIAMNQAGMASARIFPDSLCTTPSPEWDGSSIRVSGACLTEMDSVRFTIENVSNVGMSTAKTAFIIEEDLVVFMEQFQLPAMMDTVITRATDGSTVRLIAEQADGHPGNSLPTVAIEGCVEEGGSYSTGYVTDWPENDKDPFVSVHVDEFMEMDEAVALVAHPRGFRDSIITSETELTYRFVFRNIGTDTVARVVIRDTLSQHLDIGSIIPGASSHEYELEAYHTGVIKITFEDIFLPNQATPMDPNSFGFVELKLKQAPDNPLGTIIENRAYVIFDYFEPLQTNTTRHVIEAPSLDTLLIEIVPQDITSTGGPLPEYELEVKAYPNPMSEYVILELKGWPTNKPLELSIHSSVGALVKRDHFQNNEYTLPRAGLQSGSYFYALRSEGKLVGGGTLIVR